MRTRFGSRSRPPRLRGRSDIQCMCGLRLRVSCHYHGIRACKRLRHDQFPTCQLAKRRMVLCAQAAVPFSARVPSAGDARERCGGILNPCGNLPPLRRALSHRRESPWYVIHGLLMPHLEVSGQRMFGGAPPLCRTKPSCAAPAQTKMQPIINPNCSRSLRELSRPGLAVPLLQSPALLQRVRQ